MNPCGSHRGNASQPVGKTLAHVQFSGVYLLLGENAKRFLAAEVNQPKRPFCSQIEGIQGLPLEESEYD